MKYTLKGLVKVRNNVKTKIGDVIAERGYVMKWVAGKIGVTPSMLSQWCKNNEETGRVKSTPHVVYILRLCKLLNCEVWDLFELIEEE